MYDFIALLGDFGTALLISATLCSAACYAAFARAHRLLHDGQVESALTAYGTFHRISRVVTAWRAPTAACIGYCYLLSGDPYEAIRRLDEAMEEAPTRMNGDWPPIMKTYKAMALSTLGDYMEAEQLFTEVEQIRGLKPKLRQAVVAQRAANQVGLGRYAEAELAFNEVLKGEMEPNLRAWCQTVLAVSRMYRGNLTDAKATTMEALSRLQTLKPHTQVRVLNGAAPVLLACGEVEAASRLEPQLAVFLKSDNLVTRSLAQMALAEIALSRSDLERARRFAEEAVAEIPFAGVMARALLVQAEVFRALKNRHRAMALCQNVIASNASAYHVNRARTLLAEMERPAITTTAVDVATDAVQTLRLE